MEKKVFRVNKVVFREGDVGTSFFRIESGIAGVYINFGKENQRKLTDMRAGQYFGEMAIIEARIIRSATVVAEEELHVTEIPGTELDKYFKEEPEKILALMKQLSGRIRSMTEEYDEVTAFLQEKQDQNAQKKPGFFEKLMKYIEQSEIAKRYPKQQIQENENEEGFAGKGNPVLPYEVFNEGEVVFREGDKGDVMYAVHGGSVDVFTNYHTPREKKLTTLYTNAFFGEMGMLDQEPRSATVVVAENGTILERIGPDDLQKLFEENPLEVNLIMRHLSKRLRKLTEDYDAACEEAAKTK